LAVGPPEILAYGELGVLDGSKQTKMTILHILRERLSLLKKKKRWKCFWAINLMGLNNLVLFFVLQKKRMVVESKNSGLDRLATRKTEFKTQRIQKVNVYSVCVCEWMEKSARAVKDIFASIFDGVYFLLSKNQLLIQKGT